MKASRFTETQIVAILKEADDGMLVKDVCPKHGHIRRNILQVEIQIRRYAGLRSQASERAGTGTEPTQTNVCRHGP
jgi:hypothetical protein